MASASTTGTSIGVEFGVGGSHGIGAGLASTDVAGVVPTAHWNVASGDTGSLSAVQDVNGTSSATSVTVTWFSSDTWNNGGTANFQNPPDANATADNVLNNGYLDGEVNDGGGVQQHSTVTFSGLVPGSKYDVYVTSTGGTAEVKGGNMVVNPVYSLDAHRGTVLSGINDNAQSGATSNNGSYVLATPTSGGNYHFFGAVTVDGSGNLEVGTGGNYTRIPINSVELVAVPEPGSLALLGIGAFGLLARRRRA